MENVLGAVLGWDGVGVRVDSKVYNSTGSGKVDDGKKMLNKKCFLCVYIQYEE